MTRKLMSVHDVTNLTGVTARTLHHYDSIGLLKPSVVTEARYRLYEEKDLIRLQEILFFRELQFPLKEIKRILDSPDFDPLAVIAQQIELLELQYQHMGEVIAFAREIQNKGVLTMNFNVFDKNEIEKYKTEVKEKWGDTKAYQEYKQRNMDRNEDSYSKIINKLIEIFSELGKLKHLDPNAAEVQNKISALQKLITDNYYECTKEILSGLGEMYVYDKRFKNNIDKAGGDGTADFVKQAITVYCSKK